MILNKFVQEEEHERKNFLTSKKQMCFTLKAQS